MKLTVLGIGSATPQLDKHPSAFLLQIENEIILIDCGEGTQYRLLEQKLKPNKLKTICISHLHGDHYFGLVGLLSTLSLSQRSEALTLIGPPELKDIIALQLQLSNNVLNFELKFIATSTDGFNLLLKKEHFKIESFPLIHRVPTTGFLITEAAGKRHILADKLPEGFPIPFILKLKDGQDVVDPITGKTYAFKDFTSEGQPEKRFAYCSDTAYNPDIIPFVKGADLMYHEATFTSELENRAEKTQHSTAAQAAKIAKLAEVKKLIRHFSSRYKDLTVHFKEARAVFAKSELAEEGKSYVVR